MLTLKQEQWVNHLTNERKIYILPFDETAEEKFQIVKKKIQAVFGNDLTVSHRGASSLRISGQDEIDVYIPVPPSKFDSMIEPLERMFGSPRSTYPMERVRFVDKIDDKHIDLFLINEECVDWLEGLKFEEYLKGHPEDLEAYRQLKESGNGLGTQDYYRQKKEFINEILSKASK